MLKLINEFSIPKLNEFLKCVNIDIDDLLKDFKSTESWWGIGTEYHILALGCIDLENKNRKVYVAPVLKNLAFESLLNDWFDLILWEKGIK